MQVVFNRDNHKVSVIIDYQEETVLVTVDKAGNDTLLLDDEARSFIRQVSIMLGRVENINVAVDIVAAPYIDKLTGL